MKPEQHPAGLVTVKPPGEARPDTIGERRSSAHLSDPQQHWQHPGGIPDSRIKVESSGAPQRNRARQTEPHPNVDVHARKQRRAPLV
jgi:hypothetical protein